MACARLSMYLPRARIKQLSCGLLWSFNLLTLPSLHWSHPLPFFGEKTGADYHGGQRTKELQFC